MTEGLITRLGRWIDHHWESKATESMVHELWSNVEQSQIKDKLELKSLIRDIAEDLGSALNRINERLDHLPTHEASDKEIADLKTRLEKIELYSGMTRKVDPTKPPVVKSAFSM